MKKETLINILGYTLIILFIYNLVNLFVANEANEIVWLCNHVPLIAGIAILKRNQTILVGEFSLLAFASAVWIIDMIALFSTGSSIIGDIRFLFDQNPFYQVSTVLIHGLFIPIALTAIFLIKKPIKKAYLVPLIHGAVLILIALTNQEKNYNCILNSCIQFIPTFTGHALVIILVYTGITFAVTWALNKFLNN